MKGSILSLIIFLSNSYYAYGQAVNHTADRLVTQDSANNYSLHPIKLTSFIVPAVFIGYGTVSLMGDNTIRNLDYSTSDELEEDHPSFLFQADNYLRYAPIIAIYGLDLVGIKAKNKVLDRTVILLGSYALVSTTTDILNGVSNRTRPDGSNDHSFPSGHTSLAFMTAELLHQEYKDQSNWYSIGGYAIATTTGILRLYNDQHWVSDIVAGASFGILSTKLIYLVYPYAKKILAGRKSSSIIFSPGYQHNAISINIIKKL